MIKRTLLATLIGVTVTLLLIAASFAADDAGYDALSQGLFWQNWLLQSLLPAPSMDSLQHPFAHGMPAPFMVWFASIPLGFVIYGLLAYVVIGKIRRRM